MTLVKGPRFRVPVMNSNLLFDTICKVIEKHSAAFNGSECYIMCKLIKSKLLLFVVGHEEVETGKLKFNKFEEKKKFRLESKK